VVLWVWFSLYFAQPFFFPRHRCRGCCVLFPSLFPIAVVFFFLAHLLLNIFASRSLVACVLFLAVVFKIIFITFFFFWERILVSSFFLVCGRRWFRDLRACVRVCVGGRTGVFLFSFVLVFCLSLFCVCASLCVCVCVCAGGEEVLVTLRISFVFFLGSF
jgi:hypothetical protein